MFSEKENVMGTFKEHSKVTRKTLNERPKTFRGRCIYVLRDNFMLEKRLFVTLRELERVS